jgi:O-antigen/teichoic acid export membrane protein
LSVSSVIGALAALLSWIIATRLVDPAEIGKASQFVSALLLVAGAVQLNLDVGLLRWLPGAGRHAGRLVWRTLLLVMLLAAVVGLVYALLLPSVARSAAGGASPWFGVALFVLAAAGWSVFTLHDSVLVALGRPWWTAWRNGAFATSRIGLLVALGGLGFGAQGIVLSWVGSIVLWIAAGTVVLAVLLQRSAVRSAEGSLPSRGRPRPQPRPLRTAEAKDIRGRCRSPLGARHTRRRQRLRPGDTDHLTRTAVIT